ncbi:disease resistance protein Roq1-like [Lotus japonicus]|uniref:disease resistance protein Roq1-like n=1 Tax=Lotus japonicus TaxID=34305 RepID=UPI00259069C4|nr:disease resistance protein Roq1-like [Lotus japonicus]
METCGPPPRCNAYESILRVISYFFLPFEYPTVNSSSTLIVLSFLLLMALLPSFSSPSCIYDAFLSFRGPDTRHGFAGNLWKALSDRGIHTFIDDVELERGEEITPALVKAIDESRIAIPVFSTNYASSSFCLDELVNILDHVKAKGRLVLPIFYNVDPSHVRHQIGSFGEALAKHEERFKNNIGNFKCNMERLQKWKVALHQVANLSGHHFKLGNEYEHDFIAKIVKEVSSNINRTLLHVANYPVGLKSRVEKVLSLLDLASDDGVFMVGIYGIGGIGKTTLVRAVYNLIANRFKGFCFLHNVRENSNKHGLEHLQEKLLSKTLGLNINFGEVSEGISIIKQRLHRKKVLLVLDDVDELKQLQAMVGGHDWLGPGSRVVITTRDKHLLERHGIERTYEVDELNWEEALALLRWSAFKSNEVDSKYKDILNCAVTYASGLPLALEVIGSNLFGKSIEEWKSALDRYKRIPNKEIQKLLKVSFDALEEEDKSVFLDIACCFKWYPLVEVYHMLHAHHGVCMKHHIGVLVEKSLIKIIKEEDCSKITIHDLIEDMGKEIVRFESPKEPGKRSRLWFHKDIVHVLEDNTGTCEIEIIYLHCPSAEALVEGNGKAFKKMKNLKTLIIKSGHFSEVPKYLPSSLRVLEWQRYPSQYLPSDFYPKKLTVCKLSNSCFTSFKLSGLLNKKFINLKILNFDYCEYLTEIPDVSDLNLEELSFEYCEELVTIHSSVGFLDKLRILNAEGCSKLRSFPPMELSSLERLNLSHCRSLESFPEILGKMENLKGIYLERTSIEELPFSFGNLVGLDTLILEESEMFRLTSSIVMMPNLSAFVAMDLNGFLLQEEDDKLSAMMPSNVQHLCLSNCKLSDEFLPLSLSLFANVEELDLSWNDFTFLPECIKECRFLWKLTLNKCKRLREIRGIPPNLKHFCAMDCKSLTSSCISMFLNQELHEDGNTEFCLPGIPWIPEWFEHRSWRPSISFWFRGKLPSIALFLVSKSMESSLGLNFIINGHEYALAHIFHPVYRTIRPDHAYLYDLQLQGRKFKDIDQALLENEWNHAEIILVSFLSTFIGTGIHIFKQKSSIEHIRFTCPYKKRKLDYDHHNNHRNSRTIRSSAWHPLPRGVFKFNVDGSS